MLLNAVQFPSSAWSFPDQIIVFLFLNSIKSIKNNEKRLEKKECKSFMVTETQFPIVQKNQKSMRKFPKSQVTVLVKVKYISYEMKLQKRMMITLLLLILKY